MPWAVVTSGTRPLLTGWLDVLKLTHPKTLVVAEDVEHGKPDPACYLLGREKLGMRNRTDIIVIEDAPSGVRAGKAAGFRVVGLITTHTIEQIKEAGADWIVQDLRDMSITTYQKDIADVQIRNSLVM